MTLAPAFPQGLTDDLDTITAAQALLLDTNQAAAVDGAGGGSYAPSTALTLTGAGLGCSNLQTTTIGSGQSLTRSDGGHWPTRTDTATIIDTASDVALDMTYDRYWTNLTQSQTVTVVLQETSGNAPVDGDEIEVVRIGTGGGFTLIISEESAPASPLATFPAAYSKQIASTPLVARFFYLASAGGWQRLKFSADVSP